MFLSRAQLRSLDRRAIEELGVPGVVLMENAGRGAAELLWRLGVAGSVAICCGKGNNGGDGFVIARHLDTHGVPVRVHLFGSPDELSPDAAVMYRIVERAKIPITVHATGLANEVSLTDEFAACDWVIDALFGTGLSGPIRRPLDVVIDAINESGAKVLAVDIPSGLDCDTGKPLGPTVRASHTATFVALKKGYAEESAREWLGQAHVVDIGAPRQLLESYSVTPAHTS